MEITEEVDIGSWPGMNILGLVMFSVAFGIVISIMKDQGKPLADLFQALEGATMRLVVVVIWYGPIGITFLIAAEIVDMKDPITQLEALGMYMLTVILGLIVHGFILLPILYILILRKNPIRHFTGVLQALFTALGTDSSSATLPVTIRCMEDNNKCDSRVARFVLPLGATVNMNGSALYEAVAAIYISQVLNRDLSIGQVILVSCPCNIGMLPLPTAFRANYKDESSMNIQFRTEDQNRNYQKCLQGSAGWDKQGLDKPIGSSQPGINQQLQFIELEFPHHI